MLSLCRMSMLEYSTTRNPVELLGPCFKTGRIVAPRFALKIERKSVTCNAIEIVHNSPLSSILRSTLRRSVRLYFAEVRNLTRHQSDTRTHEIEFEKCVWYGYVTIWARGFVIIQNYYSLYNTVRRFHSLFHSLWSL